MRLHSSRPPPSRELGPHARVASEAECEAAESCRRRYRDHADIHVAVEHLLALLRPALGMLSCTGEVAVCSLLCASRLLMPRDCLFTG